VSEATGQKGTDAAPPRSRLRGLVATWPRRIGALVGSSVLAWAVGTYVPKLLDEGTKAAGLGPGVLAVDVVTDVDLIDDTKHPHVPEFVIAKPIEEIGPPPNGEFEEGRYAWAHGQGGVDALESLVRFVVRGETADPVVLTGLRVEIVERGPPLAGTLLSYFGLGAPAAVRFFEIDLDVEPPRAKFIGDDEQETTLFPYRVSDSELEIFDVVARSLRSDVSWRLRLDYVAKGEQGTTTIDDDGKPFRTTARHDVDFLDFAGSSGPPRQIGYGWLDGRWQELTAAG
jgi:hypothetical protein